MKSIQSIFILICLATSLTLHAQQKDSLDIIAATNSFVKAFSKFDWATFKNAFSKDATIFFPTGEYGKRVSGNREIEAVWTTIFPEFLDPKNTFELDLNPQNVLIQMYGNSAIVTFHLGEEEESLYRRTVIFIKENEQWKIAHLHASSVKQKK